MPDTRTERVRGRTPDWMGDRWLMAHVARRFQNKPGTDVCAVTGERVELDRAHYYVTARKPSDIPHRDYVFEHFVVAIDALEELENRSA